MSNDFLRSLQDCLVNYLFAVLGDKYLMNSKGVYPAIARKAQTKVSRRQRKVVRHEKGSNNYNSQANKIARLHLPIARQWKDFYYSIAHWLAGWKCYTLVTIVCF
ncbi:MAG: transposase [Synechococcales bacterium]|nr:transposase [Synechococcales bacterium]